MALENKYDTSVPLKFVSKVKLTIEDERMSKYYDQLTSESIYKLPLAIRNTNTEKGFGIHATQNIKENTIVAFYCGVITTIKKMPYTSSDLYDLEYFENKEKQIDALIIIPIKTWCGFGRFFNGARGKQ